MNQKIILRKVKVHNLKEVSVTLPTNAFIVFSGVSGSGKSSLAFDTLYAEGQRRYVESLSHYARRQMNELAKPLLEQAEGLSPTISIEQKSSGKNPRSTVGTMTEIYDYLRVLFARVGIPHCPISGEAVRPQSRERIIRQACSRQAESKVVVLAPYARSKKGEFKEDFSELQRKGFIRVRIDGKMAIIGEQIALDGNVNHDIDIVVDRLVVNESNQSRIAEAITTALALADGVCLLLEPESGEEELFSMHAFSPASGLSYSSLEPSDFSFNSPAGMCETCHGMGTINQFDLEKVIEEDKSIAEDCCLVASSYSTVRYGNIYDNLAQLYGFNVHTPWKALSEKAKKVFLLGTEKKWTKMRFVHPETGAVWVDNIRWKGVLNEALTRYSAATSEIYRRKMNLLMSEQLCPACNGGRLKPYPAAALIGGKKIAEITSWTIAETMQFFDRLKLPKQEEIIAIELLKEIAERLSYLMEVGLHYLTLNRTSPTLSGGEGQRVRLASQLGCGLVGITYILDEPSIGLHHRDNSRLIATLQRLRDRGNTVIAVEHDEETILAADYIVDVGPGAGKLGGEIVYSGPLKGLLTCSGSLTADYLLEKKKIAVPKQRRKAKTDWLHIAGARHNNLKNIDVKIPLGRFVVVTGVSGSGKSSLINGTLYPYLSNALQRTSLSVGPVKTIEGIEFIDKIIAIDQSPIGRNPRSNPATYIKLFDEIRLLYSQLPESRARGYTVGRFSFNRKEGACLSCGGMGMLKIDMDFLEDAWVECDSCNAKRFDEETLSILYKGYSIHDVLEMDVSSALELFSAIPSIAKKLELLKKVGLEYVKLGQASTTLSGGEAQRIKLAKELARPSTGKTIYLLDEPTTGLHFHDISLLVKLLGTLVDKGNSVIVVEHNLDIIKTADWVIDLGPDGGEGGGQVVAAGTPEQVAKTNSPTAYAIKEALAHKPASIAAKGEAASFGKPFEEIIVERAEQNNLKHINAAIPRNKMTVCTGPSGSGKSSFAFDTLYAEGQRRYAESLSAYARQFVKQMAKPKIGKIEGLSPAIAIEQKNHAGNPRSTVGTITETYDYLRIIFACLGIAHCPETGEEIKAIDKKIIADTVLSWPQGEKLQIMAPIAVKRGETFGSITSRLLRHGFLRIRLNKQEFELGEGTADYDPKRKNELLLVIDRIKIDKEQRPRLLEAIAAAAKMGNNQVVIQRQTSGDVWYNLSFGLQSDGKSFAPISSHTFSFNHEEGMCLDCSGLGVQYGANLAGIEAFSALTPIALARWLWDPEAFEAVHLFEEILNAEKIPSNTPIKALSPEQKAFIFQGSEEKWTSIKDKKNRSLNLRWIGLNHVLAKISKSSQGAARELILPWLDQYCCPTCRGVRLNSLARAVTLYGKNMGAIISSPIDDLIATVKSWPISLEENQVLHDVNQQLLARLTFLEQVGVGYLSLERQAPTLSGGEMQRLRLARQLGSGLTGVLYVLDEPTIGLHPKDTDRLHLSLKNLLELGNTLLLVEHDPITIAQADYILDFGPGAGALGGHITARGSFEEIKDNPLSLTGDYLSGRKEVAYKRKKAAKAQQFLQIRNASKHNLKGIDVDIPVGNITVISGVSGSGKSTLMNQVIMPAVRKGLDKANEITIEKAKVKGIDAFDKMIVIDQNPIGHTTRSDVGTYTDVLTRLREFFSQLPQAKIKGFQPKHFSCNQRKGMCSACWGMGYKRVELYFLPDLRVQCEECQGMRLNPVSLTVLYKDKNFGQYLQTTVDEARIAFENHPRITRILDTLIAVGLGYLTLGQEMASLSGGEAQRIKLSRELGKRSTGKTLYLLDEPTTGLHSHDIAKLLTVLEKLTAKGNSVVIIEHNLDVIRFADWVIELGPEAGEKGGRLLCCGTPEQIKKNPLSPTSPYL